MLTNTERSKRWASIPLNRAKKNAKDRTRRETLKQAGLCLGCGTRSARSNRIHCEECAKVSISYLAKRGERYAASGLCYRCGDAQPLESLKGKTVQGLLCESCYLKKRARSLFGSEKSWQIIRDRLVAQDYRCAYTGTLLQLGVNDSVDHMLPSFRFPAAKGDTNNVEWVTRQINEMKRDRTPQEFVALIESILQYRANRPSGANVRVVDLCVA